MYLGFFRKLGTILKNPRYTQELPVELKAEERQKQSTTADPLKFKARGGGLAVPGRADCSC